MNQPEGKQCCEPQNILMIKSHSAGIGDLLRSSAAWRALRNRFPKARLHLWMITKDPGSASEVLIGRHPLLTSCTFSQKKRKGLGTWNELLAAGRRLRQEANPDMVIDFEPAGLRTSLLCGSIAWGRSIQSIGIAQAPLRRFFYTQAAPSVRKYAEARGIALPMDYTERDFVVLDALGIQRGETQIELNETEEAKAFRNKLEQNLGGTLERPVVGVNLGCGTPGALDRRPDLDLIATVILHLWKQRRATFVLMGAPYEAAVNRALAAMLPRELRLMDLAGATNLLELPGAIRFCDLFITADSGPYHMAVALRTPTIAVFNLPNPEACHQNPWTRCVTAPKPSDGKLVVEAAENLLQTAATRNLG